MKIGLFIPRLYTSVMHFVIVGLSMKLSVLFRDILLNSTWQISATSSLALENILLIFSAMRAFGSLLRACDASTAS